jgi:hypothetical protein
MKRKLGLARVVALVKDTLWYSGCFGCGVLMRSLSLDLPSILGALERGVPSVIRCSYLTFYDLRGCRTYWLRLREKKYTSLGSLLSSAVVSARDLCHPPRGISGERGEAGSDLKPFLIYIYLMCEGFGSRLA